MTEIKNPTCFMNMRKLDPVKFGQDQYPLFTRISIETSKVCNRTCWFCPAEQRGKKQQLMSDELYAKIIDELHDLNFNGVVQWFFINEPLMDRAWESRIKLLRTRLPECTIHITSNWDLHGRLSDEKQIAVITRLYDAGVNSFNINDYDDKGYGRIVPLAAQYLNERVRSSRKGNKRIPSTALVEVRDHCWQRIGPRRRVLSCGPLPKALHTRTGYVQLENIETFWKGGSQKGKKHCPRPFRHIVVQYDGKVPLCCTVDPTTSKVEWMGDINKETLVEVWNKKRMWEYRALLQDGRREGQCKSCDAKFSFPSIVRRVDLGAAETAR